MKNEEQFNLGEEDDNSVEPANDQNIVKHIAVRMGILLIAYVIIFLVNEASHDSYFTLAIMVFGVGLTVAWLVFLLVESLILYKKKKNLLGNTNLIIIGIFVFFGLAHY